MLNRAKLMNGISVSPNIAMRPTLSQNVHKNMPPPNFNHPPPNPFVNKQSNSIPSINNNGHRNNPNLVARSAHPKNRPLTPTQNAINPPFHNRPFSMER